MIKSCPGQFYAGRRLIKKKRCSPIEIGLQRFLHVTKRYFAISSASILIQ